MKHITHFLRKRCRICGSYMFHDGQSWHCPKCG